VVVAHDQLAGGVVVADEFLQLQLELASVGAQFNDVGVDLQADPRTISSRCTTVITSRSVTKSSISAVESCLLTSSRRVL
jgi:hypothetical protein